MKRRSYKLFIEDILEAMDKIDRYIKGGTNENYLLFMGDNIFGYSYIWMFAFATK